MQNNNSINRTILMIIAPIMALLIGMWIAPGMRAATAIATQNQRDIAVLQNDIQTIKANLIEIKLSQLNILKEIRER